MYINRAAVVTVSYGICFKTEVSDAGGAKIKSTMGNNLKMYDYDESMYTTKGYQASTTSDLNCNFESPCCWYDLPKGSNANYRWYKVGGSTDSALIKSNFNGVTPPSGSFLAISQPTGLGQLYTYNGRFSSCSFDCSSDLKVTFKHWRSSPTVLLQLCTNDAFMSEREPNAVDCHTVTNPDPGPSTFSLPKVEERELVFLAKGFIEANGGVVAIDDITVSCGSDKAKAADNTASTSTGLCAAVNCDFGKDGKLCGWTNTGDKKFENRKGRIGNRITGVSGPSLTGIPFNENYQGVELAPSEKAILTSGGLNFIASDPKILKIRFYENVDGLVLKACSNDLTRCDAVSNPGSKPNENLWQENLYKIPTDTKKILLVGENNGNYKGALGIDKIDIVSPPLQIPICL